MQKVKVQLTNTNCSIDMQDSDKEQPVSHKIKGKKRIGRYSFYLKNMIGSGYSSKVYKGIKDNNKSEWYAIKVVKLKDINTTHLYLLNNQIDIMQKLNHHNIVKFIDVQYTCNHCYLVTEYCEGGTLEQYMNKNQSIQWGQIIYQISQGCQYLANSSIIHRDLKPANIFLRKGVWKIGDFGFSKRIPSLNYLVIQKYKIGSPLFMPLETLQRNMYSAKNDSFALGVIIYLLIFREFPWHGNNINELIKNCHSKNIDFARFQFLPLQIAGIVKGLCDKNIQERLQITNCNFNVFQSQKSIKEINRHLHSMLSRVTEQVVLCQFINYLIKNSLHFLQADNLLYSFMSKSLTHLTNVFKWDQNKCLKEMKKQYILCENHSVSEQLYRKILYYLQSLINLLKFRKDSRVHQVATEKLLDYYYICKFLQEGDIEQLLIFLKSITLHVNFKDLVAKEDRIKALMKVFQRQQQ